MAHEATRAACFRPNEYRDHELFANRHLLRDEIAGDLRSFFDPKKKNAGEAKILLRGNRGVGKSILARRVIRDAIFSGEVLYVEVDCARTFHGVEQVLRTLSKALARETIQNALDEGLRFQAEALLRFSEQTKVRVTEVKNWAAKLKLGSSLQYGFVKHMQFEFGLERISGHSREVQETSERVIDSSFLQQLLSAFLVDCKATKTRVLLLVDNLDQTGFAERVEEVERIMDLVRFLFTLDGCVVMATLRSEFASSDLTKYIILAKPVPNMLPEELREVAAQRMKFCADEDRQALQKARFEEIASTLSQWTGNAWAYLGWLEALDYSVVDIGPDEQPKLKELLFSKIRHHFGRLGAEALLKLGQAFAKDREAYQSPKELAAHGVDEALLKLAHQCIALIPDYALSPECYMLSPLLHFLA